VLPAVILAAAAPNQGSGPWYDGVEADVVLVNEAKVGQAPRQDRVGNVHIAMELTLEPTDHRL